MRCCCWQNIVQRRHRLDDSTSAALPGGAGGWGAGIYGGVSFKYCGIEMSKMRFS